MALVLTHEIQAVTNSYKRPDLAGERGVNQKIVSRKFSTLPSVSPRVGQLLGPSVDGHCRIDQVNKVNSENFKLRH